MQPMILCHEHITNVNEKVDHAPLVVSWGVHSCYTGGRRCVMGKLEPLIWTDDDGNQHLVPNIADLPPEVQDIINELMKSVADSAATFRKGMRRGKKLTKRQAKILTDAVDESVNIILRALLTRVPQAEIERHDSSEKLDFVLRWLDLQGIPLVLSA